MTCKISAELIKKTIAFHGHSCPGLVIGIRAAELAMCELGCPNDIEMVAVVETDMCGVDAIQFLTGCTYGKGNLIHHDFGKTAFSFYDRKKEKGVRLLLKLDARGDDSELCFLMGKRADGTASEAEIERTNELRDLLEDRFMKLALEDMFHIQILSERPPRPARILESMVCGHCAEAVMESRTRRFGGQTLCIPCFEKVEQKI
jgi:formylmethanofuran dehydrogenase subunit E